MSDLTRTATAQTTRPSQSPAPSGLLQRQCACGQHTAASGECAACRQKRQGALQRSPSGLAINRPGDRYEQEAERVAAAVLSGGELPGRTLSSGPALRRDGPPAAPSPRDPSADERRKYPGASLPDLGFNEPKNDQHVQQPSEKPETNEDRLGAAGEKLAETFLETTLGKQLTDQAEKFGEGFISTLPSLAVSLSIAAGTVATMALRNEEFPLKGLVIKLTKLAPGLKVKLTYKGPLSAPTEAGISFAYEPEAAKKPQVSDTDRTRADTERIAADQAKFQKGAQTPAQRAAEQRQLDAIVRGRQAQSGNILGIPGLTPRRDDRMLQRDAAGSSDLAVAPPLVDDVLSSPGQPLDPATRSFMEPRFGHDFSGVRVHTDGRAAASARDVSANAYTVGHNVVFGAGRFAPETHEGKRLIAHELTHVVQQQSGAPSTVRRDTKPLSNAPAQSADPLRTLLPQIPPEVSRQFSVRTMKESEFQAITGVKVASIPEKRLLSPTEAGLVPEGNAGALAGMGAGMLFAPRPSLPLPLGTTGVLWSAGAHLSQFAVVPQGNPVLAFFFGDTTMTAYGFRANALLHSGASVERGFDTAGGPLTAMLNRGVAGNYVNDAIYPYLPLKGGSVAIHAQGGAENMAGAQELADCMAETSRSGQLKGTYRFSTPPRNKPPIPSPAFDRAFGPGKAADPNFAPPEIVNCLNKANQLTRMALQGRDLIQNINGRQVNISTATFVDTGDPVPDMLPSAAKSMPSYLAQWDNNPSAQGSTRTPITAGTILNGVTGVIRIGGFVLMIVNLVRAEDRYTQANEYEKPLVAGEEATLLTAGLLGSLIGEVLGEAVLCVGTGPGAGLCVLAVGLVGGAAAVGMSGDTAHGVGKTLQDAAELNRQGKLLPGVMEAATQVLGTEQQRKLLNDMKKTERPEPGDGLFDLFRF